MERGSILTCIGVLLILIGITLSVTWNGILEYLLNKELRLAPTSKSFTLWQETPVPITLEFYFFNWTNPENLLEENYKANLVEVGPYIFQEFHEKVNITWNENHTISYKQIKRWYFDEEKSNGTLKDNITTLNVVALSATSVSRYRSAFVLVPLSGALRMTGQKIWITKMTGELLFEGYSDPILTMAVKMPHLAQAKIPADKFGWFYQRNGSADYEGMYNMETGAEDISRVGQLQQWNYDNRTDFYEAECGLVNGSAGELFPPGQTRDKPVQMFSSDLCRSISFEYSEDTEVEGIPGYRFVLGKRLVDNGTLDGDNWCNCGGQCVPQGVLNVSSCRHGAPAFVSYPHFLDADPYYTRLLNGVMPDASKHRFYLTLEPTTGIPLDVAARLQINLLLQPSSHIAMYNDVPTIFFPMMWFEERATITPELAASIKLLLMLPVVGLYCALGLILVGVVIIVFSFLPKIMRRNRWSLSHRTRRKQTDRKPHSVVFTKDCIRPLMSPVEQVSPSPEGTAILGSKAK
ncbi:protein croquemort-like isoform X2 [Periplaneta americana]